MLVQPLMMELEEESQLFGEDYHTQNTVPPPPLTTKPAEELPFLEACYYIRDMFPVPLLMMRLGEGFSTLEVD